ncbi:MAG TPA: hypothetical protein VHX63_03275 [Acidobacteriaceae bacterium]|jgi:membrane protein implicated in regulation of membrane protease activity|nr:hypothetical protein [Acidobacteriaceae bacterium]
MGLDIRIPMGLLFTITGALMTGYGFITRGSPIYAKSLGVNLNLDWGLVMLAFGIVMLWLGRRGQKRMARETEKQSFKLPGARSKHGSL